MPVSFTFKRPPVYAGMCEMMRQMFPDASVEEMVGKRVELTGCAAIEVYLSSLETLKSDVKKSIEMFGTEVDKERFGEVGLAASKEEYEARALWMHLAACHEYFMHRLEQARIRRGKNRKQDNAA